MEQLAQLYKALSEETRIRIMMLLTQGELCVCDIQAVLDEPQSKVSRHLAYLKHSGLVSSKRVGVWMHYVIKRPLREVAKRSSRLWRRDYRSSPYRADRKKLQEFQKQKGCDALTPPRKEHRTVSVKNSGEGRRSRSESENKEQGGIKDDRRTAWQKTLFSR